MAGMNPESMRRTMLSVTASRAVPELLRDPVAGSASSSTSGIGVLGGRDLVGAGSVPRRCRSSGPARVATAPKSATRLPTHASHVSLRAMFGWLRKKKAAPDAAAPARASERWAPYLTPAQERRFEELARAYFAQRGITVTWGHGTVRIGEQDCGLDNVAQTCRQLPEDDWALVIAAHFDKLANAARESEELNANEHAFEWMATKLRLRLYPADLQLAVDVPTGEWGTWREDLEDTRSTLVVDLPSTVVSLRSELPKVWGRRRDELFARALQNVAAECPVEVEELELDRKRGVRATVLSADHVFVASHALRLDAWPELLGPHGTLFCIPNRHTLIAVPVTSASGALAAVQQLLALAIRMFEDGPGSTSPHVYWRTPTGAFATARGSLEGRNLHVLPSDSFAKLLERLPT